MICQSAARTGFQALSPSDNLTGLPGMVRMLVKYLNGFPFITEENVDPRGKDWEVIAQAGADHRDARVRHPPGEALLDSDDASVSGGSTAHVLIDVMGYVV